MPETAVEGFSSNEKRDRMLKTVLEAQNLKPRDVVWMAFSPDRTLREAAPRLLTNMRTLDTVDQFIVEARTRPEAAVRAGAQVLIALKIPGTESHLSERIAAQEEATRDATRRLVVHAPESVADDIADQLPRVDYATQQHLIKALTKVARGRGPEFADRLLPLMSSGEAGIRSAVIKILLDMEDRQSLIKRHLRFSTKLAGWPRDRALDSLKAFGDDLVEPTLELLSNGDEEVRRVASSDPDRVVRARALEVAEQVARRDNTTFEGAEEIRANVENVPVGQGAVGLHAFLVEIRNQGASDFHLSVSSPPMVRVGGELVAMKGGPFSADQVQPLLGEILDDDQRNRLARDKQLDLCYYIPRAGRYRANIFLDRRGYNAVFRVIPEKPPNIHDI